MTTAAEVKVVVMVPKKTSNEAAVLERAEYLRLLHFGVHSYDFCQKNPRSTLRIR